ncbi:hypothetical protein L7E55_11935 [Pelotomaculum isophthalicicum JI]|uniref:Uncharacterized protein n=1 Tax=Pelotomaculum isophthalicicum JI TaxID=947010 RepID=A0A9X4H6A2_9FIRM|nr:hypothetical protein [Pelotomaculum isophthalicicum]MDF9409062.1 hypothetical protein [Pelotomaculum isophthalicicum JI]
MSNKIIPHEIFREKQALKEANKAWDESESISYDYTQCEYIFSDGTKTKYNFSSRKDLLIKIFLPACRDEFLTGFGESVKCLVDQETKKLIDKNITGRVALAMLQNDSLYYPGLIAGEVVAVELRGPGPPIAIFEELVWRFGGVAKQAREYYFNRYRRYNDELLRFT